MSSATSSAALASPAERAAPFLAGVLLALPTLVAYYPPMSDLPLHEGAVGLLRHYGDAEYCPPGLYELNLGEPNQLFHLIAWAISYLAGTRWAVKLVIAGAQIAILVCGARLSDHLGRSRWAALLLAPLALGYTYYWGLVANLVGFAALFGTLPLLDRACERPSRAGVARVLGAFALLFLAHETVLWIAIGYVLFMALARCGDRSEVARQLSFAFAPAGLAIGLLAAFHVVARRSFTQVQLKVTDAFTPLGERLRNVPNDLFGSHDPAVRLALFLLALVAVAALVAARWRFPEQAEPARGSSRAARLLAFVVRYRFELSGLVFVLGFFASPQKWNTATLLYSRFAGPAWGLLALTAGPRSRAGVPVPALAKLACATIPLAVLLVAWPQFAASDRSYRDLDALLAQIPKKSSTAAVRIDPVRYGTRVFNVNPGPARVVAERGGRASLSLVGSPIAPVRLRPQFRWDEFDLRNAGNDPANLLPASDLERFEWVVAQSREEVLRRAIVLAFRPDAELVDARGEWLLLRSTHRQLPLTAPDSPQHSPTAASRESLLERVNNLLVVRSHD